MTTTPRFLAPGSGRFGESNTKAACGAGSVSGYFILPAKAAGVRIMGESAMNYATEIVLAVFAISCVWMIFGGP
jgi:hypothetical protein